MPYDSGAYDAAVAYDSGTGGGFGPNAHLTVSLSQTVAPAVATVSAAGSTAGTAAISTYTFIWGDGTANTGPQAGSGATHTYTADGSYNLRVTVTDTAGLTGAAIFVVTLGTLGTPDPDPPGTFHPEAPPEWNLVDPVPPAVLDQVYAVQLSWGPPVMPLGGMVFVAYHLERQDDSQGWRQIARITSQAVLTFIDYEARPNVAAQWRMRVEATSGFSLYSDPTVEVVPHSCGLSFTSNENPTLNIQRQDIGDRSYDWQVLPGTETWPLHSRNKVVTFRDLEDRGDLFDVQLLLWGANGQPINTGRQAGEVIRRLLLAEVTYICVRDEGGARWFAALEAQEPALERKEPGSTYFANLTVQEVAELPSVVDVTS